MLLRRIRQLGDKHAYLEPVCIGLGLFIIYNATLPVNMAESHDSLSYLASIQGGENLWLFHPHHLLYSVLGKAFYEAWQFFGYVGDASIPLQELNIIFACMTIAALYVLLRNVLNGRWRSMLVCAAVAFSFGFWFYASTIEVYIIHLFFLFLSFSFLLLSFQRPTLRIFALVGVCNALAILFHQMNVLFAATVLVAIVLNPGRRAIRDKVTAAAIYALCVSILVFLAYIIPLASIIKPDSPGEALYWFTGYLHEGQWGKLEVLSPVKAVLGFSHTFIGGHFLFSIERLGSLISSTLGGKFLVSQKFLVDHLSAFQAQALLLGSLPLVAVFIVALASYMRSWREIWREHYYLLILSIAWLVPYAIFILWWEPYNLEFWIATLIPIWLIALLPFFTSGLIVKMQRVFPRLMYMLLHLAIVCMLLVNLFGSMLPLHSPERDYYLQKSSWYMDNAKTGDLIICSRYWLWGEYLKHYSGAEVMGVAEILIRDKDAAGLINRRISQILDSGGLVYITSDAVHPETTTLESYGIDMADFISLWTRYQHSWVKIDIDTYDECYVLSAVK